MRSMLGAEDVPGFVNLTLVDARGDAREIVTVAVAEITFVADVSTSGLRCRVSLRDGRVFDARGSRAHLCRRMRAAARTRLEK